MAASTRIPPIAVTGATLIDGSGSPPLAGATIVIEDGRFSRVGPSAATPLPDGVQAIDGRGRFVMPGLADMHVHAGSPDAEHLPLFLAAGVTSVLDLGGQVPHLTGYRTALAAGTKLGPRFYFTGPLLEEGDLFEGFAHMSRHVDAEDIETEVDRLADAGADAIKLYITVTPETARRAAARAHARGLPVFMHQQATWGADAAEAGVDCLEHLMVFGELAPEEEIGRLLRIARDSGITPPDGVADPESWLRSAAAARMTPFEYGGWMWRWMTDVDPRSERVQRLYDRLLRAGTAIDPTLVLYAARPAAIGDDAGDTSMDDPERTPLLPYLPPPVADELVSRWSERRGAAAGASAGAKERSRRAWTNLLELVRGFHEAGGVVLAGTDCPNVAIVSGFSLHRELELLTRAGLAPMEALLAATRRAAERLGKTGEFGAIAPGLPADMLLLRDDPLADIRHTRAIERVIAGGRVYEPEAILAALRPVSRP